MPLNPYADYSSYYRNMTAITPNDAADLPRLAVVVATTAGNVSFIPADNADNAPVLMAVQPGQALPPLVRRVMATGTTATVYEMRA